MANYCLVNGRIVYSYGKILLASNHYLLRPSASWRTAFFIMRKTQKVVIMISVLLAPIFVFLFLKEYGSNKFDLPIYFPEGSPFAECDRIDGQSRHAADIMFTNNINLPALFYLPSAEQNEYYSDLNNVLSKYPSLEVWGVIIEGSLILSEGIRTFSLGLEEYNDFINCELVLGEEEWLQEPITNKYVLIDGQRSIRGYYECDNLDDIERLDVELDILFNY